MRFARRGGEVFLRKRVSGPRVERGLALYQRHGLLAVVVPSLLPPPMPFKLFVLLAGAAQRLAVEVRGRDRHRPRHPLLRPGLSGRAVRRSAPSPSCSEHGAVVGLALAALAVVIGVAYYLIRNAGVAAPRDG